MQWSQVPGLSFRGRQRILPGVRQTLDKAKLRRKAKTSDLKILITEKLSGLYHELLDSPILEALGLNKRSFSKHFGAFEKVVKGSFFENLSTYGEHKEGEMFGALREAFISKGEQGLVAQLKYAFYGHVTSSRFTESDLSNQAKLADLRYPVEWYPGTRTVQRTLHLHVGPTNSGKTYHALKRLEQAETGLYAGPLRLLAHEVYTRLNASGKPCNLITGDDRKLTLIDGEKAKMASCTVEMVPLNEDLEVAVIDEIQMVGSVERGWAWTQALLGLKARELHMCGEERVVPLIRELAAMMGDKLVIHQYQRLSPLRAMTTSLGGDLKKLRKGDCLVVFSRLGIHALRREVEQTTGKRVAVVYGSLPPETRAQQAKLFNDPDNDYDILIASDAIGMGLNLSIKRIVFETTMKHNGLNFANLQISDIKQIGGRAGRFRTAAQDVANSTYTPKEVNNAESSDTPGKNLGLVTSLEAVDLPLIRNAMQSEAPPITTAGIFPPASILQRFATYFPQDTPFSYILLRLHEISRLNARFHLCALKEQLEIADVIQPFKNLTISDRMAICASPTSLRDHGLPEVLKAFAKCVDEQRGGTLLDIPELKLEVLDEPVSADKIYLQRLETVHKALVLYLWLSYRFTGVFTTRGMARYVKELLEERIDKVLADFAHSEKIRQKLKNVRQQSMITDLKRRVLADRKPPKPAVNDDTRHSTWADISLAIAVDDVKVADEKHAASAA